MESQDVLTGSVGEHAFIHECGIHGAPTSADQSKEKLIIFDTTLRDGEQSPGASMNLDEKLHLAEEIKELGADVMEAGFPKASDGDKEAVFEISKQIVGPTIAGLACCHEADIQCAGEALEPAIKDNRGRIHVFLATSDVHLQKKLKISRDEALRRIESGVEQAVQVFRRLGVTENVEFSPEDGCRTDHDFLCKAVETAIHAGATTINIPDTVGYISPREVHEIIATLKKKVANIERAIISVHCHNDLGLAVANSLEAIVAGARQVEGTVNGIGERAGNTAVEELIMNIRTRPNLYPVHVDHITTQRLVPVSRSVSNVTGIQVQRNKAIVGRNAFAHEAGIHQDGILKERTTYEIMRPEDVGFTKTDLVLGKHSGRAALADRIKGLGYRITTEVLDIVFEEFKKLADKKKEIFDSDIDALVRNELKIEAIDHPEWKLDDFSYSAKKSERALASITITKGHNGTSETITKEYDGDGPLDAIVWAIKWATGIKGEIKDYKITNVNEGSDAMAEVRIVVEVENMTFSGSSVSTDTIEASTNAYLMALNKFEEYRSRRESTNDDAA